MSEEKISFEELEKEIMALEAWAEPLKEIDKIINPPIILDCGCEISTKKLNICKEHHNYIKKYFIYPNNNSNSEQLKGSIGELYGVPVFVTKVKK